jgi:hypothetical protein
MCQNKNRNHTISLLYLYLKSERKEQVVNAHGMNEKGVNLAVTTSDNYHYPGEDEQSHETNARHQSYQIF